MGKLTLLEGTSPELAWVALAYQLHDPSPAYTLRGLLTAMVTEERHRPIVVIRVDEQPVGVATIAGDQVNVYVKPAHRRQGVGRWLVQQLVQRAEAGGLACDEWYGAPPDDEGVAFFMAMGIGLPPFFQVDITKV